MKAYESKKFLEMLFDFVIPPYVKHCRSKDMVLVVFRTEEVLFKPYSVSCFSRLASKRAGFVAQHQASEQSSKKAQSTTLTMRCRQLPEFLTALPSKLLWLFPWVSVVGCIDAQLIALDLRRVMRRRSLRRSERRVRIAVQITVVAEAVGALVGHHHAHGLARPALPGIVAGPVDASVF